MPPLIQSITAATGRVTLTWTAVATQSYQVQYKTGLAQTNRTNLGAPSLATNGTMQATDLAPSDAQRWYRVLALP
jgi:hypothetical protein